MKQRQVRIRQDQKELIEQEDLSLTKLIREGIDEVRSGERELPSESSTRLGESSHRTSVTLTELDTGFIEENDFSFSVFVRDIIDDYEPPSGHPRLGKKGEMPPSMRLGGRTKQKKFEVDGPLSQKGTGAETALEPFDIHENKEAYVYVLELNHSDYDEKWYYVGLASGGIRSLKKRLDRHFSTIQFARPVEGDDGKMFQTRDGEGVVKVESVERIVEIEHSKYGKKHYQEVERRTAYEVALEYDTTNVLGGK